jgi:hypothetical protein
MCRDSAELYDRKNLQQKVILTSLNEVVHFDLLGVVNTDGTIPDGCSVTPTADIHNAMAGFYELQNEIGTGSSDPAISGALSHRKTWVADQVRCVP